MRKYLATLPDRSDKHKRRFAFMASGAFTLLIFGFWSASTFGVPEPTPIARQESDAVSPFESVQSNLATPWQSIKNQFKGLGNMIGGVDVEEEYKGIRQDALNSYGR